MHYADIAEEVAKRELRSELGATPANTVNANISDSIRVKGVTSPYERVSPGYYRLRRSEAEQLAEAATHVASDTPAHSTAAPEEPAGLINALGMYWSREKVNWALSTPKLFGRQQSGDVDIDFSNQRGVYLLHDRNAIIYVGRAVDQGIGTRLRQHISDRLGSRWDRFSWFGIYGVTESGVLADSGSPTPVAPADPKILIATMEALLIEAVEPPQNRRRGDDFRAVEFLQGSDREIEVAKLKQIIHQYQDKIDVLRQ